MNPFEAYRITNPYGPRPDPFTEQTGFHTGINLDYVDEAPLFAFMGGEVIHTRFGLVGSGFGGFGNVVALKDCNAAIQFYALLSSISVNVGDIVKAGQEVGRQGNTGHSTGSHMHFEVRTNGMASGFGFGSNTEPTVYLQKYMEDDEAMKEALAAVIKRIEVLEEKTRVLDKTPAPEWFKEEFGTDELVLLKDATGDYDFWRNVAITIRFVHSKK
jgi:murein DD-endopeptidase MepM/ murein hydrolase activator NlpD